MEFTITPNPDDQCFDIRIKTKDHTSTHHATTADVLEWFRKLVVECDCEIKVSAGLVPLDTPEPRYLILNDMEDLPHNCGGVEHEA